MDTGFCLPALDAAFRRGKPEIFNSDRGAQFTSAEFVAALRKRDVKISMDGRGRCIDNLFYRTAVALAEIRNDLPRHPHQALHYKTPAELYRRAKARKTTDC